MIYLNIKSIQGNVTAKGYENAIEIYSYSFSSQRSINNKVGLSGHRSSGLLQYGKLTLIKLMDRATATLLKQYYAANVIPEISFHHVSTGAEPQCYFVNTFKDVLISGHSMDCDSSAVTETFELSFDSNQKRIVPLDANNKLDTPESVGYNLQTAQAL